MLWKAIDKLVSCGTAVFIGNGTDFPHGCSQRRESLNSTLAFPPREWKKKGARVNNSFNQLHTHETKGIFFAAQPEEERSDWHSGCAASHCGREVFCSHYSPMVLVIDSAFSWLWQRIKVSLSIISFTFPACFPPLCASSRAHVQLTLSEHGDLLWICINAKDCLIFFFSAAMAGWSNSLASILLMKECTSLQLLATDGQLLSLASRLVFTLISNLESI